MAIKMSAGDAAHADVPMGRVGRTVALVDLRPGPSAPEGARGAPVVFALALREIEQAVRSEDRVCPFGSSRLAVAFGPDADTVSPRMLGQRLARAVRRSSLPDGAAVNQPRPGPGTKGLAPRTRSASAPSSATVVVDRMIGSTAPGDDPPTDVGRVRRYRTPHLLPRPGSGLWRRTVVHCSSGSFARYGTRHDDIVPGESGTILVVSPSRAPGGAPGLSAVAASSMAERLGYRVGTVALCCDEEIVLDVSGTTADLVVMVIEGEREPTSDRTTWSSSTWHIPAQLTSRFCSKGIGVLAVGAGGGAGALASCIAQGADVVLDFDELQARLRHAVESPAADDADGMVGAEAIPRPMEALVLLTASERRVLFYLTIGRSAQDIADELVVSVTTVRSHIRSILRKLGVRSQLAAVAIANSQDFERKVGAVTPEIRQELEAPGVA
jgi:DNA-binding NarL/FixJ family response regulator